MIVSLYLFPIPADIDSYRMAHRLLSPVEQGRYQRIVSQRAREAHVIGRAVLRLVGSRASHTSAQDWPLAQLPGGKPYCPLPDAPQFNLSHTSHGDHGYGLLAMATAALGVDLEVARAIADLRGMAAIALSARERTQLLAVPAAEQSEQFLRLWTLKEAILKATGTGFRSDPRAIDFGELTSAALENAVVYTHDGQPWFSSEIFVGKQLVAALCSAVPAKLIVNEFSVQQLQSWLSEI